jgi:putative transposase
LPPGWNGLVQLQRATFHYQAHPAVDDEIEAELEAIAQANPRYGYRRAWALVRRKRPVNRKRVHRLWKRAKLHVKRVKRPRVRCERPPPVAASYPNHVWAYDFVQDQDMHGRTLYILPGMDAFAREGLAIAVAEATSAEWVIRVLNELVAFHGPPAYLRSDNGAAFVALAVQAWLARRQVRTRSIDPGCPWQNGKEERFNGTVRDECRNLHRFASAVADGCDGRRSDTTTIPTGPTAGLTIKPRRYARKPGKRPRRSSRTLTFLLD